MSAKIAGEDFSSQGVKLMSESEVVALEGLFHDLGKS
jgi:hypothetical protein